MALGERNGRAAGPRPSVVRGAKPRLGGLAICAALALSGCEMDFEMPETDWFGRSHEVPVAQDPGPTATGSPTPLALAGLPQPPRAATGTASPPAAQAPAQGEPGVALAPADSLPLLASRDAAYVAGTRRASQTPRAQQTPAAADPGTPTRAGSDDSEDGSFKVQLASYLSLDAVEREWARLQAAYPELVGDKSLSVRESDLGADGVVYGVRTGTFPDIDSAQAFCAEMAARNEDCLVVGGPGAARRVASQGESKALADVQKEALFEQFLQWQRRRSYGIDGGETTEAERSELFERFLEWREQRIE